MWSKSFPLLEIIYHETKGYESSSDERHYSFNNNNKKSSTVVTMFKIKVPLGLKKKKVLLILETLKKQYHLVFQGHPNYQQNKVEDTGANGAGPCTCSYLTHMGAPCTPVTYTPPQALRTVSSQVAHICSYFQRGSDFICKKTRSFIPRSSLQWYPRLWGNSPGH